jgi:hypothetical protein
VGDRLERLAQLGGSVPGVMLRGWEAVARTAWTGCAQITRA